MKKTTRRLFLKRTFGTILATVGISAGGSLYAHKIEPTLLHINELSIKHDKISESFNGLRIAQFSDTHLGFQYNLQQLEKLITTINKKQPDLIIFTGDLIDNPNTFKNEQDVITLLSELDARLGKFCVFGNHDHGGYGTSLYKKIMSKANFNLLLNKSVSLSSSNDKLHIIGVDDAMLGKPDLKAGLHNIPDDDFKILLSHAPDLADDAQRLGIDLQLSGHSHGGQVKVPFLGALVKPPYGEKYVEGTYKIGNENQLTLHVNRGLGTTRLPFRFLARPELTFISLFNNN